VREAIRFRLNWLKSGNECLDIPREQYEELNEVLKEIDVPFRTRQTVRKKPPTPRNFL
jgi:hypothetical protein